MKKSNKEKREIVEYFINQTSNSIFNSMVSYQELKFNCDCSHPVYCFFDREKKPVVLIKRENIKEYHLITKIKNKYICELFDYKGNCILQINHKDPTLNEYLRKIHTDSWFCLVGFLMKNELSSKQISININEHLSESV